MWALVFWRQMLWFPDPRDVCEQGSYLTVTCAILPSLSLREVPIQAP